MGRIVQADFRSRAPGGPAAGSRWPLHHAASEGRCGPAGPAVRGGFGAQQFRELLPQTILAQLLPERHEVLEEPLALAPPFVLKEQKAGPQTGGPPGAWRRAGNRSSSSWRNRGRKLTQNVTVVDLAQAALGLAGRRHKPDGRGAVQRPEDLQRVPQPLGGNAHGVMLGDGGGLIDAWLHRQQVFQTLHDGRAGPPANGRAVGGVAAAGQPQILGGTLQIRQDAALLETVQGLYDLALARGPAAPHPRQHPLDARPVLGLGHAAQKIVGLPQELFQERRLDVQVAGLAQATAQAAEALLPGPDALAGKFGLEEGQGGREAARGHAHAVDGLDVGARPDALGLFQQGPGPLQHRLGRVLPQRLVAVGLHRSVPLTDRSHHYTECRDWRANPSKTGLGGAGDSSLPKVHHQTDWATVPAPPALRSPSHLALAIGPMYDVAATTSSNHR